jgi:hypothetical protein
VAIENFIISANAAGTPGERERRFNAIADRSCVTRVVCATSAKGDTVTVCVRECSCV